MVLLMCFVLNVAASLISEENKLVHVLQRSNHTNNKQSKKHGFLKVQGLSNHTDKYVRFSFTVGRRLHIFLGGEASCEFDSLQLEKLRFLKMKDFQIAPRNTRSCAMMMPCF